MSSYSSFQPITAESLGLLNSSISKLINHYDFFIPKMLDVSKSKYLAPSLMETKILDVCKNLQPVETIVAQMASIAKESQADLWKISKAVEIIKEQTKRDALKIQPITRSFLELYESGAFSKYINTANQYITTKIQETEADKIDIINTKKTVKTFEDIKNQLKLFYSFLNTEECNLINPPKKATKDLLREKGLENLVDLLVGAEVALESKIYNPDYIRHFSVSLRELLNKVIERLAPKNKTKQYIQFSTFKNKQRDLIVDTATKDFKIVPTEDLLTELLRRLYPLEESCQEKSQLDPLKEMVKKLLDLDLIANNQATLKAQMYYIYRAFEKTDEVIELGALSLELHKDLLVEHLNENTHEIISPLKYLNDTQLINLMTTIELFIQSLFEVDEYNIENV